MEVTDPVRIAVKFNNYFSDIGINLAQSFPSQAGDFRDFLAPEMTIGYLCTLSLTRK